MTELEQQQLLLKKVVDVTVSGNHTIFKIEELIRGGNLWMKETKNYGKLFLKKLSKMENHFNLLEDSEMVIQHAEEFHDFMEAVRPLDMDHMVELTEILKACEKDRMMMLSVARRINN